MSPREKLIQYSIQNNGDWLKIAESIKNDQRITCIQKQQTSCITIYDQEYPESLRMLRYPPWVLYYQGDISLLQNKCMTIVGSRELSEYGKKVTEEASKILCKKYVITSGLAKGADACAHHTAIINHGKTIGVIGSGLGYVYPKCNTYLYDEMKKNHLILSEYPYHTSIQKHHFVWRNRILAALGEKCIVTSAKKRSGTMLTVNEAITLGKDVYCFPYEYDHLEGEGCNLLINEGAQILYDREQLKQM